MTLCVPPHKFHRFEVAIKDLDPRTNTKDWIKVQWEVKELKLRNLDDPNTKLGSELDLEQEQAVPKALKDNKDLFAWTIVDIYQVSIQEQSPTSSQSSKKPNHSFRKNNNWERKDAKP